MYSDESIIVHAPVESPFVGDTDEFYDGPFLCNEWETVSGQFGGSLTTRLSAFGLKIDYQLGILRAQKNKEGGRSCHQRQTSGCGDQGVPAIDWPKLSTSGVRREYDIRTAPAEKYQEGSSVPYPVDSIIDRTHTRSSGHVRRPSIGFWRPRTALPEDTTGLELQEPIGEAGVRGWSLATRLGLAKAMTMLRVYESDISRGHR